MLSGMDESLRACVIGQDEAVEAVSRAIQRTRCGLKDPNRPIGSMLFAGPTGVGKTELTKCLAGKFFGSEDCMVRLDMSEYMERHSVSKLVGAPPGYVGFGQGGTLTEAVRRRPFTILLFDEIEKAHPDVFNVLLQIMEDGRLTDSQGRVVSFKNVLVVLTSNVGSKVIVKGGQQLGFSLDVDGEEGEYAGMRQKVLDELKNFFRPEMLNRLDEVVCFRQLDETSVEKIARIMLRETAARMREKGMELAITPAAMTKILDVGFDKEYGARPLRRAITSVVDDTLSEALLRGVIAEGDTAVIDFDPDADARVGVEDEDSHSGSPCSGWRAIPPRRASQRRGRRSERISRRTTRASTDRAASRGSQTSCRGDPSRRTTSWRETRLAYQAAGDVPETDDAGDDGKLSGRLLTGRDASAFQSGEPRGRPTLVGIDAPSFILL